MLEIRLGAGGELAFVEGAGVAAAGRDEPRTCVPEPVQHPLDVLVVEDRRDDRPIARFELLEQPVDGLGRMRAVADLVRPAALEAAGKLDLNLRFDRMFGECLRSLTCTTESD